MRELLGAELGGLFSRGAAVWYHSALEENYFALSSEACCLCVLRLIIIPRSKRTIFCHARSLGKSLRAGQLGFSSCSGLYNEHEAIVGFELGGLAGAAFEGEVAFEVGSDHYARLLTGKLGGKTGHCLFQ